MEYEDFCKFVEESPLVALQICHSSVNRLIQRSALGTGDVSQIQTECERTLEFMRIKNITGEVSTKGFVLPPGMHAYLKRLRTFIRWLPGHEGPICGSQNVLAQQKDWFMHRELQVMLRWNEEGFYEMNREDSQKFNCEHSSNHWLLPNNSHSSSSNNDNPCRLSDEEDNLVSDVECSDEEDVEPKSERSPIAETMKSIVDPQHSMHIPRASKRARDSSDDGEVEWIDPGVVTSTSSNYQSSGLKRQALATTGSADPTHREVPNLNKKQQHVGGIFWTPEMDERLIAAMQDKPTDWSTVEGLVGKTKHQCRARWATHLSFIVQKDTKQGPWSEDEVARLKELVPQCLQPGQVKQTVDWQTVAKTLHRTPRDCANRWNLVATEGMVKGKFSFQEDAVIKRRVAEFRQQLQQSRDGAATAAGGQRLHQGLWDGLQKELNRPAKQVEERWNRLAKWM